MMEENTQELMSINSQLFDLVTEMAAGGDERCNKLEEIRMMISNMIFEKRS